MKTSTRLQPDSTGAIRGFAMKAGFKGTEYILVTESMADLRRVWRDLNPHRPLEEADVQRVEIRRAK